MKDFLVSKHVLNPYCVPKVSWTPGHSPSSRIDPPREIDNVIVMLTDNVKSGEQAMIMERCVMKAARL